MRRVPPFPSLQRAKIEMKFELSEEDRKRQEFEHLLQSMLALIQRRHCPEALRSALLDKFPDLQRRFDEMHSKDNNG